MASYIFKICLLSVILSQNLFVFADNESQSAISDSKIADISITKCIDASDKHILKTGWYAFEPYQFTKITVNGYKLTGMDVELAKRITQMLRIDIEYMQMLWATQQNELAIGGIDMAFGATYTNSRAEFAYFSIPYRFEENSLFVLSDIPKKLIFQNTQTYLAQVRLQNYRLGIIKGSVYADSMVNDFIVDKTNNDIIYVYDDEDEALRALLRHEIDGFMCDRVVGAAIIFNKAVSSEIEEIRLNIKTPIHFMFSKSSVPLELVDKFNNAIKGFIGTSEYKSIIKNYLYPVLLLEIINSKWFYIFGMIGTIAFAISGIAIAAKDNITLFGTFLLAMIPSVGGGIMRDVIIDRATVGIILTPSYMYYIIIVVLVGFATFRLLNYYSNRMHDNIWLQFWDNLLIICDAIGQAAFIVIGVSVVIMARIEPIELWAPFFAFLTSNGGGILRDMMRQKSAVESISGEINPEISIIWGLIFSIFLDIKTYDPNQDSIRYAVIMVVIGAFVTKLMIHYFKIPNIRFRSN